MTLGRMPRMSKITAHHEYIILDADCTINLASSGQLINILRATGCSCTISGFVHAYEVLRNDIQPCIEQGLLEIVKPRGEEYDTIVQINFDVNTPYKVLGDGEIETSAIAAHRNWAIGIDDRAAREYLIKKRPHLGLITTPEFLKHWVDTEYPVRETVKQALEQVRIQGNYIIGKKHPLYDWWHSSLH